MYSLYKLINQISQSNEVIHVFLWLLCKYRYLKVPLPGISVLSFLLHPDEAS